MRIKSVIIDYIHYINLITFNICVFFICHTEIGVRLIHPYVLYTVKCGNYFNLIKIICLCNIYIYVYVKYTDT